MYILKNVPLAGYSTMRVGGNARYLMDITHAFDIDKAVAWAEERSLPILMIGGGSNIIWRDEGFEGLILVNKIMGFDVNSYNDEISYVTIGAGENWDKVVQQCVDEGLSGIEQLSLIPGTTGATPVQNVGAYGQEIANILMTLQAYDLHEKRLVTMTASDCGFSYRDSRFKSADRDRFLITAITLMLSKKPPVRPFYESVERYLEEHSITDITAATIRDAVINIRQAKLPDPAIVANTGSFFKNPIIKRDQLTRLLHDHADIAYWDIDDYTVKLSAAWLIENAGFKGIHDDETGMATWKYQPLVLVNERAGSAKNVLAFRDKIAHAVKTKFNIDLEQEPEILP